MQAPKPERKSALRTPSPKVPTKAKANAKQKAAAKKKVAAKVEEGPKAEAAAEPKAKLKRPAAALPGTSGLVSQLQADHVPSVFFST